ncbi:GNAT family N-acetyltransferase [Brevibacillus brevis]|uniref:GNAT family N-acetyltransferase n=1 Tax=Brevibacillus brevis TaxID=1393 RepID=UPI001C8E6958|nr:GNAT family N-acetyltransferase [Brevibacillus brevis]MBY0086379.1 GNAT family N-acetyltransferase [Brevibacillus brevis]UKL00030.1 GNAT family N-acetyltransferase [Brevibacillus brevis]
MQGNGENIYVRLVQESDAQSLLALEMRNRDFFQNFTGTREETFYTLEGQIDRIKSALALKEEDRGYFFVIAKKGQDEIIGEVILSEVVRENLQSCWIGYFLDKAHNGKGYMTEAVKLVVAYAFETLGLHRLEAGVMPHNIGSIKVLLKAGFHKEGIAKKNVKINGRWEDHQTLAIVKEEQTDQVKPQVQRKNPGSVAPPMGAYTHLTVVPKGADLLVLSGQVGMDIHGELPTGMKEQVENTLQNILRNFESESVSADHIIKINIWATEQMDWKHFNQVWEKFHGGTPPAMTMSYVPALAVPSLKVEIEAWAAKW